MPATRSVFGVLITFRRHAILEHHLRRLAEQTAGLDSLVVVDNDADPRVEAIVRESGLGAASEVSYLPVGGNPGPAGGIATGVAHVLDRAEPGDLLVLLDDDDPPSRAETLESLQRVFAEQRKRDSDCVGVGLWGARLRRDGRLRVGRANEPEIVDYLPGSAVPHYLVAALREIDAPDVDLFFGFDDLELGLALGANGGSLYSSGLARRHGLGSMVDNRRASPSLTEPTWRRYYSLRNLVVLLRRYDRRTAAVWMSLVAGILKPVVNGARVPRLAVRNLRLNIRALRDGWSGRLGKTIDPHSDPRS